MSANEEDRTAFGPPGDSIGGRTSLDSCFDFFGVARPFEG